MHDSTATQEPAFDYNNSGWPRDFDIRIEVAEQQEILRDPRWRSLVAPLRRPRLPSMPGSDRKKA